MERCARRLIAAMTLATAVSACGWILPFPVELPRRGDHPSMVEGVAIADDHRSVDVAFIGGPEFDPDNPCSVAYDGTARVVGDELEIGIYALEHPTPIPPDTSCGLVGFPRTITLLLDEPFNGLIVRDLAGQVLLLGPPPTLAEVRGLPDGWGLRHGRTMLDSTTPRWERAWSRHPGLLETLGAERILRLKQAFGGSVLERPVDREPSVAIHGQPATLSVYEPTGQMVLRWWIGDDELELTGNLSAFSQEEFIALAESVIIPSD